MDDSNLDSQSVASEPSQRQLGQLKKVSIGDLFAGWVGLYQPPGDWNTQGNEIDWDKPVDSESSQLMINE